MDLKGRIELEQIFGSVIVNECVTILLSFVHVVGARKKFKDVE